MDQYSELQIGIKAIQKYSSNNIMKESWKIINGKITPSVDLQNDLAEFITDPQQKDFFSL